MRNAYRVVLSIACFVLMIHQASVKATPPNIIVIMADQWRAQSLGYMGDPNVKTPHLDALSRESLNLTNAIASVPVCCPTRASFLTGQHALTTGVFLNDVPLDPNATTLAKVLKNAGFDTAYVGKWHLNGDGRSAFIPRERRQGFDYWKALECTHDYNDSFYYDGDSPQKVKWPGYDAIAQTHDAAAYFRDHAKSKKPFFFMLAWGPPHNPYFIAPEKYRALYDPNKLTLRANVPAKLAAQARRELAGYYANCSALDDCIAEVMQTLQETGLEENTLVVFTADHGDMLRSHGLIRKQKPWDESLRVPLLLHWPRGFGKKGRALNAVFCSEDFMPTLLGLCHLKIPKTVEGIDYSGYLRGGKNPSDNAAVIAAIAPFGEWTRSEGGKEIRGVRTTRYTFVRDLNGPWLFYDNDVDPLQMTNLVNLPAMAKEQRELDQLLQSKLRQRHDEFLPGDVYVKRWGYKTNANGTVPYTN